MSNANAFSSQLECRRNCILNSCEYVLKQIVFVLDTFFLLFVNIGEKTMI